MFGLSLVAAIIDSIRSCVRLQQKSIRNEMEVCQRMILKKIHMAVVKSVPHKTNDKKCSIMNGLKYVGVPLISHNSQTCMV